MPYERTMKVPGSDINYGDTEMNRPRKPRVLHVYKDYYPPVMGGVELTINVLAEGCLDEFDVSVLVNSTSRKSSVEEVNGVRVVKVSEWGRAASAPISPAFVFALGREAKGADIIHFHHPNPTGDLARFLSRPAVPCVMTYHSDVVRQRWAMAVYGHLQNWQMARCEVIMPTSPNYMRSSEWLQQHEELCEVVPLGIRMDYLQETPEISEQARQIRAEYGAEPLTLFVGRLRYYKGLHFLIEAAQSIPGFIILAGTGPVERELKELAVRLGVKERVRFLGDISEQEKVAWYHAADVFCMPSHLRSEAFGLSQVEAMACGTPVVSCNIESGVPFVNQSGTSGLTVPPEDPVALASALRKVLSDEDLRKNLSEGARDRARREFTAEVFCSRVKNVYRRVLGEQNARKL